MDVWVLILPMRNGNSYSNVSSFICSMFLSYLWGMETSLYLSPECASTLFLSYLWGMETQVFSLFLAKILIVLILPMRNGNFFHFTSSFFLIFMFLSYLWGMETAISHTDAKMTLLFLSYLWGMETPLASVSLSHLPRSYPTYEEWKLWLFLM